MKHPVVLDACTIINLLRIDLEDEFLFKSLKSLDLNIAKIVYDEVNKNIRKNSLSEEQVKHIEQIIPHFLSYSRKDDDIIKDISQVFFEELCTFTNHKKKHNGELLSSALSLCISREKSSKVYFYTDDFPAKEQFTQYFSFQQIGVIGDSVDLLLFLYWSRTDFTLFCLKNYLRDLKSEYNIPLKLFSDKIQSQKDKFTLKEKKDKKLSENIDKILNGYRNSKQKQLIEGIDFFCNSHSYPKIKCIINLYPDIKKECILERKVQSTIECLSTCNIFKIV